MSETVVDINEINSLPVYEDKIELVKSRNITISLEFLYDFNLSVETFTNPVILDNIPNMLNDHLNNGEL